MRRQVEHAQLRLGFSFAGYRWAGHRRRGISERARSGYTSIRVTKATAAALQQLQLQVARLAWGERFVFSGRPSLDEILAALAAGVVEVQFASTSAPACTPAIAQVHANDDRASHAMPAATASACTNEPGASIVDDPSQLAIFDGAAL